jgi:hypothetical protein
LQRSKAKDGDSGWYIGFVDSDNTKAPLEAIYAYQLIRQRSSILQVLALPPDYLVVFNHDRIEAILDPNDRNVWPEASAMPSCPEPMAVDFPLKDDVLLRKSYGGTGRQRR